MILSSNSDFQPIQPIISFSRLEICDIQRGDNVHDTKYDPGVEYPVKISETEILRAITQIPITITGPVLILILGTPLKLQLPSAEHDGRIIEGSTRNTLK